MAQPDPVAQPDAVRDAIEHSARSLLAEARSHKKQEGFHRRQARDRQRDLARLKPLLEAHGIKLVLEEGTDEEVTAADGHQAPS